MKQEWMTGLDDHKDVVAWLKDYLSDWKDVKDIEQAAREWGRKPETSQFGDAGWISSNSLLSLSLCSSFYERACEVTNILRARKVIDMDGTKFRWSID